MISSLLIRNFRLFKELKVNKLGRVNLFVGKNNCGKSCLLEALRIFAAGGDLNVLRDLVSIREEDWDEPSSEQPSLRSFKEIDSPYRYLFHGYHFPEKEAEAIEIGPIDNAKKRIKITPRAYQVIKEEVRTIRKPVRNESLDQIVDGEVGLELQIGNESRFLTSLVGDRWRPMFFRRTITSDDSERVLVVLPQGIDHDTTSKLWDNVNLTDLEDDVVNCLQLIDPNIEKVAFVGSWGLRERSRIPIVRYANTDERIPLKSMGDGMTRLFHIILSLVNAKNGYLLIDEFENGLHWSVHAGLWNIVFTLAAQLNVQVFATTHNRDCVRGFYEVWSTRESEGTFQRIDVLPDTKIIVNNYTCETLADALETDVEVR
jgi:hypothetical protein